MSKYKTALQVSDMLKLGTTTIHFRASKLEFHRFDKTKRIFNKSEIEQIKNFNSRKDLRLNPKYSPKKIKMIEFYLDNRTTKDISEILEIKESLVLRCINEWIKNNFSINVASKI